MTDVKPSNNIYVILLVAAVCGVGLVGAAVYFGHPSSKSVNPVNNLTVPEGNLSMLDHPGADLSAGPAPKEEVVAQSPAEMMAANDSAVRLIGAGKIDDAISILEPLLRHHPRYVRARENLCAAYNNKAVSETKNNAICLDLLRRAISLDAENAEAQKNLNTLLKCTGRDPQKFDDRVFLGDEQAKSNCLYGAYVEYTAALAIHNDKVVAQKRSDIVEKMAKSDNNDPNGAFYIRMAKRDEATEKKVGDNSVDFGPYIASLHDSVRDKWMPPHPESDEKVEVTCTIAADGGISNIAVGTSTGDRLVDQAALDAVKAIGKAQPLPMKASLPIDITLYFEQGLNSSGKPWKTVH